MDNEDKNTEDELIKVNIDDIIPNPEQPRKNMDNEKFKELIDSIKEHGVVQPVVVRPIDENKYELIAGERRWRACKELSKQEIPAIKKNYTDLEASAIALIENIQRENLNALEEAQAYDRLMSEFELTQDDVSKRLGKSRPFIANMVRLLNLPDEIKDMLKDGSLTAGHARTLISLKDKNLQLAAALKIIKRNLNVRQTEDMIKKLLQKDNNSTNLNNKKDESVLNLENTIGKSLNAPVAINKEKKGKGKIVIKFSNKDHFDKIVELLSISDVSRETT
ncbi:MAG: ParB/RepB/Spo0J family partition protein [Clostridiales bacterium]|nr:ParB/RepB/Spo0J family partition protein [Clostridiales bacterium]MCF8022480.1 ParB/RepB/Spo0J family partition protein [Clostridiales bacterium]